MLFRQPITIRLVFALLWSIALLEMLVIAPLTPKVGAQSSRSTANILNPMNWREQGGAFGTPTVTFEQYQKSFGHYDESRLRSEQQRASSVSSLSPLVSTLCVSGSISNTDPTYTRPSTTGFPTCTDFGTAFYDVYTFYVSGCTSPQVTVNTCSNNCGGSTTTTDTALYLYQLPGGAVGVKLESCV
jgi:hypothetical protein